MQKESKWECITLTSSNRKLNERALKVAPPSDGKKPLTVKEVVEVVNKRGKHG